MLPSSRARLMVAMDEVALPEGGQYSGKRWLQMLRWELVLVRSWSCSKRISCLSMAKTDECYFCGGV